MATKILTVLIFLFLILVLIALALFYVKLSKDSNKNQNIEEKINQLREEQKTSFRDMRIENANLMKSNRTELSDSVNNLNKQVAVSLIQIQQSNDKQLEQMRKTVDEKLTDTLNKRITTSFQTVSNQLQSVYRSMGEMSKLSASLSENVTDLSRVLTNVKTRGTWAEVQLENIFDQMIPGRYEKNISTDNSGRRVEFAIKIPAENAKSGFLYLPVDSKFPMEAYTRIQNAADDGDEILLATAKKELISAVKIQAKNITKYINEPLTTPFAIMYLATEGLYAEVASDKDNVLSYIQREYNVIVAGPSNIMALLSAFQMGFKTIALNNKMKDIRKILAEALKQYDMFSSDIEKAQQSLDIAAKRMEAVASRNGIMYRKIKKIDSIETENTELIEDGEGE